MPTETFHLDSLRLERVKRVQTIQHVVAAVMLATAAVAHLSDPNSHHVVLPVLELLAAVTLIGAAVADKLRRVRGGGHWRVGWVEIAGSAMTLVEAIAKLQEPHRLSFHILSFFPPVMLLLFGVFDLRIAKSIYLQATDDDLVVRLRPIRWRRFPWKRLRALRVAEKHFELELDSGATKRFKTSDIRNRDAAMAWLEDQFARRLPAQELDRGDGGAEQRDGDQPLVAGDR